MTTSSPQVNGHPRPLPVITDWQALLGTPAEQPVAEPAPTPETAPVADLVAQAEADAIRTRVHAEAEERRIKAQAEAEAIRVKAEEDARKARLANDRAERKAAEERAASQARIAEHQRRRDEADRARQRAARQDQEQQQAEVAKAGDIEKSSTRWRRVAKGFYALCAAVALPVQMTAFYKPGAEYLLVAPVFIEVIALVALVGAAAAVTAARPHWHYRLVAWVGALTAATINAVHGLGAFDAATAFGTALASVAGPGMWDLHEHGRIRKRDGKPSWRERRALREQERAEAARKAAEEQQLAAEKEAADTAAAETARRLAETRAAEFPDVWKHALRLAAALGETTVTEAVWRRAHLDIEGTDPGESAETIRARNVAAKRVESARTSSPVNTLGKTTNAQRASQVPASKPARVYNPPARPGRRRPGDTPKYVAAARKQASITARNAAANGN
ncbi:hypothetical protein ACWCXC_31615 [Streptomyces sp. NPDC001515]